MELEDPHVNENRGVTIINIKIQNKDKENSLLNNSNKDVTTFSGADEFANFSVLKSAQIHSNIDGKSF